MFCRLAQRITVPPRGLRSKVDEFADESQECTDSIQIRFDSLPAPYGLALEEVALILTSLDPPNADEGSSTPALQLPSTVDAFDPYFQVGLVSQDGVGSVLGVGLADVPDQQGLGVHQLWEASPTNVGDGVHDHDELNSAAATTDDDVDDGDDDDDDELRPKSPMLTKGSTSTPLPLDVPLISPDLITFRTRIPQLSQGELQERWSLLTDAEAFPQANTPLLGQGFDVDVPKRLYSWNSTQSQVSGSKQASLVFLTFGLVFEAFSVSIQDEVLQRLNVLSGGRAVCVSVVLTYVPLNALLYDAPSGTAGPRIFEDMRGRKHVIPVFEGSIDEIASGKHSSLSREPNAHDNRTTESGVHDRAVLALASISGRHYTGPRSVGPRLFNLCYRAVEQFQYLQEAPMPFKVAFIAGYTRLALLTSHALASARRPRQGAAILHRSLNFINTAFDAVQHNRDELTASLVYDKAALVFVSSSSASFGNMHRPDAQAFADSLRPLMTKSFFRPESGAKPFDSSYVEASDPVTWHDRESILAQLNMLAFAANIVSDFREGAKPSSLDNLTRTNLDFSRSARERLNKDLSLALSSAASPTNCLPSSLESLSSIFHHAIAGSSPWIPAPVSAAAFVWAERSLALHNYLEQSLVLKCVVIPLLSLSAELWKPLTPHERGSFLDRSDTTYHIYRDSRDAGLTLRASGHAAATFFTLLQGALQWLETYISSVSGSFSSSDIQASRTLLQHSRSIEAALHVIATSTSVTRMDLSRPRCEQDEYVFPSTLLGLLRLRSLEIYTVLRPCTLVQSYLNRSSQAVTATTSAGTARTTPSISCEETRMSDVEVDIDTNDILLDAEDDSLGDSKSDLISALSQKDALSAESLPNLSCAFSSLSSVYDPLAVSLLFAIRWLSKYCTNQTEDLLHATFGACSSATGETDLRLSLVQVALPSFPTLAATLLNSWTMTMRTYKSEAPLHSLNNPMIQSSQDGLPQLMSSEYYAVSFSTHSLFVIPTTFAWKHSIRNIMRQLSLCRMDALATLYLLGSLTPASPTTIPRASQRSLLVMQRAFTAVREHFSGPHPELGPTNPGRFRSLLLAPPSAAQNLLLKIANCFRDATIEPSSQQIRGLNTFVHSNIHDLASPQTTFVNPRVAWIELSNIISFAVLPQITQFTRFVSHVLAQDDSYILSVADHWQASVNHFSRLSNVLSDIVEFSLSTTGRGDDSGIPLLPSLTMQAAKALGLLLSALLNVSVPPSSHQLYLPVDASSCLAIPRWVFNGDSMCFQHLSGDVLAVLPLTKTPPTFRAKLSGILTGDAALAIALEHHMCEIAKYTMSTNAHTTFLLRSVMQTVCLIFGSCRVDDHITSTSLKAKSDRLGHCFASFATALCTTTLTILQRREMISLQDYPRFLSAMLGIAIPKTLLLVETYRYHGNIEKFPMDELRLKLLLESSGHLISPDLSRHLDLSGDSFSSSYLLAQLLIPPICLTASVKFRITVLYDAFEILWAPLAFGLLDGVLMGLQGDGFVWRTHFGQVQIPEPTRSDSVLASIVMFAKALQSAADTMIRESENCIANFSVLQGRLSAETLFMWYRRSIAQSEMIRESLTQRIDPILQHNPHPTLVASIALVVNALLQSHVGLVTLALRLHESKGMATTSNEAAELSPLETQREAAWDGVCDTVLLPILVMERILEGNPGASNPGVTPTSDVSNQNLCHVRPFALALADCMEYFVQRGIHCFSDRPNWLSIVLRRACISSVQYVESLLGSTITPDLDTVLSPSEILIHQSVTIVLPRLVATAARVVATLVQVDSSAEDPLSASMKLRLTLSCISELYQCVSGSVLGALIEQPYSRANYLALAIDVVAVMMNELSTSIRAVRDLHVLEALEALFQVGNILQLVNICDSMTTRTASHAPLRQSIIRLWDVFRAFSTAIERQKSSDYQKTSTSSAYDQLSRLHAKLSDPVPTPTYLGNTLGQLCDLSTNLAWIPRAPDVVKTLFEETTSELCVALGNLVLDATCTALQLKQHHAYPTAQDFLVRRGVHNGALDGWLQTTVEQAILDRCQRTQAQSRELAHQGPNQTRRRSSRDLVGIELVASPRQMVCNSSAPSLRLMDWLLFAQHGYDAPHGYNAMEGLKWLTALAALSPSLTVHISSTFDLESPNRIAGIANELAYALEALRYIISPAACCPEDWQIFSCLDGFLNSPTRGDVNDRILVLRDLLVPHVLENDSAINAMVSLAQSYSSIPRESRTYDQSAPDETPDLKPSQSERSGRRTPIGNYDAELRALGVKLLDSDGSDSESISGVSLTEKSKPTLESTASETVADSNRSDEIGTTAFELDITDTARPESSPSDESDETETLDEGIIRNIDEVQAEGDGFDSEGSSCRAEYPAGKAFSKSPMKDLLKAAGPFTPSRRSVSGLIAHSFVPADVPRELSQRAEDTSDGSSELDVIIREDTESYQPSLEQDSIYPLPARTQGLGRRDGAELLARLPEAIRRRYKMGESDSVVKTSIPELAAASQKPKRPRSSIFSRHPKCESFTQTGSESQEVSDDNESEISQNDAVLESPLGERTSSGERAIPLIPRQNQKPADVNAVPKPRSKTARPRTAGPQRATRNRDIGNEDEDVLKAEPSSEAPMDIQATLPESSTPPSLRTPPDSIPDAHIEELPPTPSAPQPSHPSGDSELRSVTELHSVPSQLHPPPSAMDNAYLTRTIAQVVTMILHNQFGSDAQAVPSLSITDRSDDLDSQQIRHVAPPHQPHLQHPQLEPSAPSQSQLQFQLLSREQNDAAELTSQTSVQMPTPPRTSMVKTYESSPPRVPLPAYGHAWTQRYLDQRAGDSNHAPPGGAVDTTRHLTALSPEYSLDKVRSRLMIHQGMLTRLARSLNLQPATEDLNSGVSGAELTADAHLTTLRTADALHTSELSSSLPTPSWKTLLSASKALGKSHFTDQGHSEQKLDPQRTLSLRVKELLQPAVGRHQEILTEGNSPQRSSPYRVAPNRDREPENDPLGRHAYYRAKLNLASTGPTSSEVASEPASFSARILRSYLYSGRSEDDE